MALTDYYVDNAAAGTGHAGTTGDPFSWADLSARMSGGAAAAGDRYNIRGNVTLNSTDTWTNDGLATSPIIIRGCYGTGTTWTPITPARSNGGTGPLATTNYPVITYDGNVFLSANGSAYIIYSCFSVSSSSGTTIYTGVGAQVYGVNSINTNGTSAAAAFRVIGNPSVIIMCDASATTGSAIIGGINCSVIGCRVSSAGQDGIRVERFGVLVGNVVYGHSGYGISFTEAQTTYGFTCVGNTIYGGYGITTADKAYTVHSIIANNHITDCSGYGIYNPNASGCPVILANNRIRDCTSGAVSWNGDWATATTFGHVTTDTGGAETDYTNAAGGDFRLILGAAGRKQGVIGLDIGAMTTVPAIDIGAIG